TANGFRYPDKRLLDYFLAIYLLSGMQEACSWRASDHCRAYQGQSAYDFQRLNASMGAAPSIDTLKRRITDLVDEPLCSCGFTHARVEAGMQHFDRLGYKANAYLLVNDATALLPALGYNTATDEVLGFALSDEELALLDIRAGDSVSDFLDRFDAKK